MLRFLKLNSCFFRAPLHVMELSILRSKQCRLADFYSFGSRVLICHGSCDTLYASCDHRTFALVLLILVRSGPRHWNFSQANFCCADRIHLDAHVLWGNNNWIGCLVLSGASYSGKTNILDKVISYI